MDQTASARIKTYDEASGTYRGGMGFAFAGRRRFCAARASWNTLRADGFVHPFRGICMGPAMGDRHTPPFSRDRQKTAGISCLD